MRSQILAVATAFACLAASRPASGEFTTVFNSPPDALPVDAPFESNTQINIHAGYTNQIGDRITLGEFRSPATNTELNLLGGEVRSAHAWDGSTINIMGGHLSFPVLLGGRGTMSGGEVRTWSLFSEGYLEFSGGHAQLVETGGLSDSNSPKASLLVATGGEIDRLDATGNVYVEGGAIGNNSIFRGGGFFSISGGSIGDYFETGQYLVGSIPNSNEPVLVGRGGRINMSGGSIGENMGLYGYRTFTLSGGTVGAGLQVLEMSHMNIVGSQFFIDGMEVARPEDGRSIELTARNVTLSGLLADGESFEFDLHSELGRGDYFSPAATLTVTFVPEANPIACSFVALGIGFLFWRYRHPHCAT